MCSGGDDGGDAGGSGNYPGSGEDSSDYDSQSFSPGGYVAPDAGELGGLGVGFSGDPNVGGDYFGDSGEGEIGASGMEFAGPPGSFFGNIGDSVSNFMSSPQATLSAMTMGLPGAGLALGGMNWLGNNYGDKGPNGEVVSAAYGQETPGVSEPYSVADQDPLADSYGRDELPSFLTATGAPPPAQTPAPEPPAAPVQQPGNIGTGMHWGNGINEDPNQLYWDDGTPAWPATPGPTFV